MNEKEKTGLRRLDGDSILPAGFGNLTEEEVSEARAKHLMNRVELERDQTERVNKSRTAEHDLSVSIDTIRRLDQERKVYSKTVEGETGSGRYELKIKGGDTKFIISILLVIGVIILALVLVFILK